MPIWLSALAMYQGARLLIWTLLRRIISGGGNIYTRFMLGIPVHDCTAGFRCYRREVLENIDLD